MQPQPLDGPTLAFALGLVALAAPIVLLLMAYDLRWIWLARRAGITPPWGTWARLLAAILCHGGAFVLASKGAVWPRVQLVYWMHMLLDPGLTLYALGLWELTKQALDRPKPSDNPGMRLFPPREGS
jgi:hypothetical protein